MAHENGLSTQPNILAELGPGDSLGIGLAALISGANRYYSFDVRHAGNKRNIEIFDELVELFKKREHIPDETEFPCMKPYLKAYGFPAHILTDERLNESLKQDRIRSIRNALLNLSGEDEENKRFPISPGMLQKFSSKKNQSIWHILRLYWNMLMISLLLMKRYIAG